MEFVHHAIFEETTLFYVVILLEKLLSTHFLCFFMYPPHYCDVGTNFTTILQVDTYTLQHGLVV